MDDPNRAFRNTLAATLNGLGVRRRFFDEQRGLTEFLMDLEESDLRDEREIAAMALEQLCEGAADHILNQCVFVAVVSYLDQRLGTPDTDPNATQRLRDLVQVYPNYREQYVNWARTWYP